MTEHLPSDPVAAACLGRDALEFAAEHQRVEDEPDHGQFYDHGRELVSTLTALNNFTARWSRYSPAVAPTDSPRSDAGTRTPRTDREGLRQTQTL